MTQIFFGYQNTVANQTTSIAQLDVLVSTNTGKFQTMPRQNKQLTTVATILIVGLSLFCPCVLVQGTVYYVDFEHGNDGNNGLTRATAWKHIPGTREGDVSSSPFVTSNFGEGQIVERAKKIQSGSSIKIKSGSIHHSGNGGAVFISDHFNDIVSHHHIMANFI